MMIKTGYKRKKSKSGRMLIFLLTAVITGILLRPSVSAKASSSSSYSVDTWEELTETFEKCSIAHEDSYTIYYPAQMDSESNHKKAANELFATGVKTFSHIQY